MEDKIDLILCKLKAISIKYKWVVFILIGISIIIYSYSCIKSDKDIHAIADYYNKEYQLNNIENSNEDIIVHIDGAVNNPGVYALKVGSRVDDIIKLANGFKNNANTKIVNLAKMLNDGEKIYIYTNDEEIIENIVNNSKIININNCTKEELMTLPGIGDSIANRIIEYRKNKSFNKIEDIKNVNGIGESKYHSIKDYISVK
ncbi:MAG: helix-hairpin-helix domain-containing protein [Clostridia bacterium]|nr:helix-hairpin-helix domain-containing protein [Clostridia bacterium]